MINKDDYIFCSSHATASLEILKNYIKGLENEVVSLRKALRPFAELLEDPLDGDGRMATLHVDRHDIYAAQVALE